MTNTQYTLHNVIGQGGMGKIYKAIHPTLNQPIAIKLLSVQETENQSFRQRFQREAQLVAQLDHPHIVPLYDFGEDNDTPYIVMQYIAGNNHPLYFRCSLIMPPHPLVRLLKK